MHFVRVCVCVCLCVSVHACVRMIVSVYVCAYNAHACVCACVSVCMSVHKCVYVSVHECWSEYIAESKCKHKHPLIQTHCLSLVTLTTQAWTKLKACRHTDHRWRWQRCRGSWPRCWQQWGELWSVRLSLLPSAGEASSLCEQTQAVTTTSTFCVTQVCFSDSRR